MLQNNFSPVSIYVFLELNFYLLLKQKAQPCQSPSVTWNKVLSWVALRCGAGGVATDFCLNTEIEEVTILCMNKVYMDTCKKLRNQNKIIVISGPDPVLWYFYFLADRGAFLLGSQMFPGMTIFFPSNLCSMYSLEGPVPIRKLIS